MASTLYILHKSFRKWSLNLHKTLGIQMKPQIMIIAATIIILIIQYIIYILLSSQTIYCKLPNMRSYHQQRNIQMDSYEKLPTIYVVTPTYRRFVQKAELTRLSHTLMLVPNVHWIIVEDSEWTGNIVDKLVKKLKNEFDFHTITKLHATTPEKYKLKRGEPSWIHPKGIWQRNRALDWIRENLSDLDQDGVIYFADDDNTYDLELFSEMRYTRKVSVWPVGLVGGLLVERPMVHPNNERKVHSFNSMWERKRPFPFDMAGFAISMKLFTNHLNASFSAEQKVGFVESHFLNQLVDSWDELEPKADKCTKVLVWHTKTQNPTLHEEKKLPKSSISDISW